MYILKSLPARIWTCNWIIDRIVFWNGIAFISLMKLKFISCWKKNKRILFPSVKCVELYLTHYHKRISASNQIKDMFHKCCSRRTFHFHLLIGVNHYHTQFLDRQMQLCDILFFSHFYVRIISRHLHFYAYWFNLGNSFYFILMYRQYQFMDDNHIQKEMEFCYKKV